MRISKLMSIKHLAKYLGIYRLMAHTLAHTVILTTTISDVISKLRYQYGIAIIVKENGITQVANPTPHIILASS